MIANKLIEHLEKVQPRTNQQYEDWLGINEYPKFIKNAIKFYHNEDLIELSDDECTEYAKNLKLPYPLCFFEFANRSCVLARELSDDFIIFQVFFRVNNKFWYIFPPKMMTVINKDTGSVNSIGDHDLFKECMNDEKASLLLLAPVGFMIRFVAALNCSNTYLVSNEPSAKLQKARLKRGKLPLFEYKTLHVKLNETRVKKQPGGGTHASPRVHLRRGHIRHLPQGNIWVNACVVGDKSKGVIHKDYEVVS